MNEINLDGLVHDAERLKELQSLPLERKIQITQTRIIEFVERMGGPENVVVSCSGGKDSTVLLHIARQIYPDIKAVYSNTGLEYPEVQHQARMLGADFVRPKMRFDQVITTYGYPLVGKEVAEAIYYARRIRNAPNNENTEKTPPPENVERCTERDAEPTKAEVSGGVIEREQSPRGQETYRRRSDLTQTRDAFEQTKNGSVMTPPPRSACKKQTLRKDQSALVEIGASAAEKNGRN